MAPSRDEHDPGSAALAATAYPMFVCTAVAPLGPVALVAGAAAGSIAFVPDNRLWAGEQTKIEHRRTRPLRVDERSIERMNRIIESRTRSRCNGLDNGQPLSGSARRTPSPARERGPAPASARTRPTVPLQRDREQL
ncbi:hypothetical protein [Methylobacterium sp. C1]|uniref:hypothetical protein n=1 Tax=Methylobacterium sp. C1 TaxID=1479019 RepID=UPI0013312FEF|nr:hypothetical protein [Methylobacterium sp. C1]